MIFIQLTILLIWIFIGSRISDKGSDIKGITGLLIFDLQPIDSPFEAMLIVLSVVMATAILQVTVAMNYLANIATKILRSYSIFIPESPTLLITTQFGRTETIKRKSMCLT